jgi:hypothetical protein
MKVHRLLNKPKEFFRAEPGKVEWLKSYGRAIK